MKTAAAVPQTQPQTPEEVAHAAQLASAAQVLIDEGHTVTISTDPLLIEFGGASRLTWAGDAAADVADDCPAYVSLETYSLACYSQYL